MGYRNMDTSYMLRSTLNDRSGFVEKITSKKFSRRLFSKLKNSQTPSKLRSKSNVYSKKHCRSIRNRIHTPRKPKANVGNRWKKEYDIWNVIMQTVDRNCSNWENKEIGIQCSTDNIQLIRNREDLNQQMCVCPKGVKTQIKDLINPDNSSENLVNVQVKWVPVVEKLTVIKNSVETTYAIESKEQDINNNDIEWKMDCNDPKENSSEFSNFHSIFGSFSDTFTSFDNSFEKTLTNTTCSTWEYSEFCNDLLPDASSTFRIDNEATTPPALNKMKNFPLPSSPKKLILTDSKTFFDSPMPGFAKKRLLPSDVNNSQLDEHEIIQALKHCQNLRATVEILKCKLDVIEGYCIDLLKKQAGYSVSMRGIVPLSDSIEF